MNHRLGVDYFRVAESNLALIGRETRMTLDGLVKAKGDNPIRYLH